MEGLPLFARYALLLLVSSIPGIACFGPNASQNTPAPADNSVVLPQEWEPAAAPTPTAVPTRAGPTPVPQFTKKSDSVFVVIVSPETRPVIDADRAMEIARNAAPGDARAAARTVAYLIKAGVLRKGGDAPHLPDDQPLWVISYQGIERMREIVEGEVRIDALTGRLYDTGYSRSTGTNPLKTGMARFDPPGLPLLVLPTPVPPPTTSATPGPYPIELTEPEKNLVLEVALREPAMQKELAQNQYEVKQTYGTFFPQYGRTGSLRIYLKDTAVEYTPSVDLATRKIIFRNVPGIAAPGLRVALTPQEEKLAEDIAYASALVKEKTAGKTPQGDFVVGYLNDKKEKMAVVVVYTGERLAYHPIVDLTRGQVVSQALKEITTFPKPSPGPPPGLTPTPPRTDRAPTPTPPPLPAIPRPAPAK